MSHTTTQSNLTRETMIRRIRAALPVADTDVALGHARIARMYQREAKLGRDACLELFIDRLLDYDTEILQVKDETEITEAIARTMSARGEQSLLVPAEFPARWLPPSFHIEKDVAFTTAQLNTQKVVATTCEAAVASTGTIVLVHEGSQGRRALTLLPDHHICLVRLDQVFETIPEALAALQVHQTKPITTISGPSATSDIEMTRIRGVHGPRQLTVILYG